MKRALLFILFLERTRKNPCAGIVISMLFLSGSIDAQVISGGPADASGRRMSLYTFSSGGGMTGDLYPSTAIPKSFGSIGQPLTHFRVAIPSDVINGGVMSGAEIMFTSSTAAAPLPTAQPSNFVFNSATPTSYTVSFTAASPAPAGYIILRKAGSGSTANPIVGNTYTAGATIDDATVVSVGTGLSFNQTGLTPGTIYYYYGFSYNGTGGTTNYLIVNPLTGNSLASAPPDQPTALTFASVTPSSMAVSFTAASSSDGYIVLRKAGSVPTATPANATVYTAGNTIGDATVAMVGAGTTFNETGLSAETDYYYQVFSYKGTGISTNYLTVSPLTDHRSTLAAEPTGQPSFLSFSNVDATTLTVSFTAASPVPSGYIAVRKAGGAPTTSPVDGTSYSLNDALGDGTIAYVGNALTFDDSGLTGGTTYFYLIYSYNGIGLTSNFLTTGPGNGSQKTATPDSTPPVITNNTPLTADPGADITIKATITDAESALVSVTVDYRSVSGAAAFNLNKTMTLVSGSYEYKVPASEVGDLGIEYKISATSSAPDAATLTGKTAILYKSGLTLFDSDAPPGSDQVNYRIIAFPLVLTPNTVIGIFSQLGSMRKDWRVFHYSPPGPSATEWKESNLLVPGQGYWFLRRSSTDIAIVTTNADGPVQGTTVTATLAQPFTINLTPGWNQIGNPYLFNVLWSDILTASGLPATLKLRTYNGNFTDGDRLRRFEGGFVNVTAATTLTIPVVKNPAAGRMAETAQRKMNTIDQPDWEVGISVSNGDRNNIFGGVGMNTEAKTDYDPFDEFALPRFLDFVELNHGKPFMNDGITKDVVPSQPNYTWNFTVESSLAGITDLTWDNTYFGKNDKHLVLVDMESTEIVDMRATASYSFTSTPSHKFKVVYGTKDYVLANALPTELAISKVFPNPSGGAVSVGFTLPNSIAPIPVQVKVINMMGQTVTRVFDGNLAPGYYEMTWNGLDDQNLRPTQGVYFMQIQGGKTTVQQRVILK